MATRGRPKKKYSFDRISTDEKKRRLREAFFAHIVPEKLIDLDEWADRYRQLPAETSSEHGQWSTARFPFLRRIMKKLSPSSKANEIVVMKGAQLGFTELAINWMFYVADMVPGPMLYCQKTKDAAEEFSKQKLTPNILANPRVHYSLGEGKPSKLSDSIDNKNFPGGFISIGGANSSAFLRSKSIRYACADEEASYESDIGHDGSPVAMIRKRQVNFPDRKLYRPSTPQLAETCTITAAYEFGTQEQYYVPCPHCNPRGAQDGFMFVIKWEQIKYSKNKLGQAVDVFLECPRCAGRIDELEHKTWMLLHGEWYSEKGSPGKRYAVPDSEMHSYHISSLYSPAGFFSWRDAVQEWLQYLRKKDNGLLQVFINQTLAEAYTATGTDVAAGNLIERRERYSVANSPIDVPASGLVLTAGVDVQKDRLEVSVVAHGLLDERWLVDYAVFAGDTSQLGDRDGNLREGIPSVWRLFDLYLLRTWLHESGDMLPIEVTFIDSKYRPDETHTFCRMREHRRIYPVYGHAGWSRPSVLANRKRHQKYATRTFVLGVDLLKNKIMSQLKIEEHGPGFIHFPVKECFGENYFKGLTSETLKTKMVGGQEKLYWDTPPGARNEPLDTLGYAIAAMQSYHINLEQRAEAVSPLASVRTAPATRKPRKRQMSRGL